MNEKNDFDLNQITQLLTVAQSHAWITSIDAAITGLFSGNYSVSQILEEHILLEMLPLVESLLKQSDALKDRTKAQHILTRLRDTLHSLPVLTLTVAYSPTLASIRRINAWLQRNSTHKILLDIRTDPSYMAGATIEYNGFHKDYSWRHRFRDVLSQRRSE